MVYRKGISSKIRCLAYVLRQEGYSYNKMAHKCEISKVSAIQIALHKIILKKRSGLPVLLTLCNELHLPRFSVKKSNIKFINVNHRKIMFQFYTLR